MIINSKEFITNSVKPDVKSHAIVEIYVDTVSELPAHDYNENFDIVQGSVAYAIQNGELYVMGGDGNWHDSTGKEVEK